LISNLHTRPVNNTMAFLLYFEYDGDATYNHGFTLAVLATQVENVKKILDFYEPSIDVTCGHGNDSTEVSPQLKK